MEEKENKNDFNEWTKEELLAEVVRLNQENKRLSVENKKFKSAEKSLTLLTSKLKAVFENQNQLYLLVNKNYIIKAFNNTASRKIQNYFKQKIRQGDSIFNYVRDDDFEEFKKNVTECFEGNYKTSYGRKYLIEDKTFWFEFHFAPVLSPKGNVNEIFISAQDITNRKLVEDELVQSENKLRALLEAIPDVVIRYDLPGKILDAHIPEKKSFFSNDEIIGKNLFEVLPADIATGIQHYSENSVRDNTINRIEYRFRKGKENYYEEARIVPIDDAQILLIFRDVTKRKEAEKKLRKSLNEIQMNEQNLKEKSDKLTELNNRLKSSEEKLRKLNANKDKFFSIIAHDLKNPFSILLGYTKLISEEFDELEPDELLDFNNRINKAANKVFDLLENLLDWARVQRDRIDFNPKEIRLNDIVREQFYIFNFQAENKKLKLVDKLETDILINADDNMITTVLRNLISNAIKYSNEGSEIVVSAKEKENEVEVRVKDSGVGIDEETRSKLFKIEENVSTYGTKNEKGTGLGLLLCKDFIELHNGKIWVESEPNVGTTFYFTLPKAK